MVETKNLSRQKQFGCVSATRSPAATASDNLSNQSSNISNGSGASSLSSLESPPRVVMVPHLCNITCEATETSTVRLPLEDLDVYTQSSLPIASSHSPEQLLMQIIQALVTDESKDPLCAQIRANSSKNSHQESAVDPPCLADADDSVEHHLRLVQQEEKTFQLALERSLTDNFHSTSAQSGLGDSRTKANSDEKNPAANTLKYVKGKLPKADGDSTVVQQNITVESKPSSTADANVFQKTPPAHTAICMQSHKVDIDWEPKTEMNPHFPSEKNCPDTEPENDQGKRTSVSEGYSKPQSKRGQATESHIIPVHLLDQVQSTLSSHEKLLQKPDPDGKLFTINPRRLPYIVERLAPITRSTQSHAGEAASERSNPDAVANVDPDGEVCTSGLGEISQEPDGITIGTGQGQLPTQCCLEPYLGNGSRCNSSGPDGVVAVEQTQWSHASETAEIEASSLCPSSKATGSSGTDTNSDNLLWPSEPNSSPSHEDCRAEETPFRFSVDLFDEEWNDLLRMLQHSPSVRKIIEEELLISRGCQLSLQESQNAVSAGLPSSPRSTSADRATDNREFQGIALPDSSICVAGGVLHEGSSEHVNTTYTTTEPPVDDVVQATPEPIVDRANEDRRILQEILQEIPVAIPDDRNTGAFRVRPYDGRFDHGESVSTGESVRTASMAHLPEAVSAELVDSADLRRDAELRRLAEEVESLQRRQGHHIQVAEVVHVQNRWRFPRPWRWFGRWRRWRSRRNR